MAKFVLGRTFQPKENGFTEKIDGVTRSKIGIVPTRYGDVLAYMTEIDRKSEPRLFTVCPGFYDKELPRESCITEAEIFLANLGRPLPPAKLYRIMDLLTVPEEHRPGVEEDLMSLGYAGVFVW